MKYINCFEIHIGVSFLFMQNYIIIKLSQFRLIYRALIQRLDILYSVAINEQRIIRTDFFCKLKVLFNDSKCGNCNKMNEYEY
jgi:hypothetical protein